MQLIVKRQYRKPQYTISKLFIDGEYCCDTLEPADRQLTQDMPIAEINARKVYGKTAIPYGTYKIDMHTRSPRYGAIAFYRDLCQGCVPRVVGVKGFEGILIHCGNTPDDTQGCLLVGQNKARGQVLNSKATFRTLYKRLKQAADRHEQITITYTN